MATTSLLGINLLSPLLFYQDPVDVYQTQEGSTQEYGFPTEFGSCKGCSKNLAGYTPAAQYHRQKIIHNTVRVQSSLYTMNLSSLSSYQPPYADLQIVEQAGTPYIVPPKMYWNQSSDRAKPSIQKGKTHSGSIFRSSSTRHTIVRDRPGAMTPGGIGVDIKHNSYDRYLNRKKARPLKRGYIPPNYGLPVPFVRAFPVYGGKIVKTGIITGCDCRATVELEGGQNRDKEGDNIIFNNDLNNLYNELSKVSYVFHIGDFVWAKKNATDSTFLKAEIIDIIDNIIKIRFEDDNTIINTTKEYLLIYFNCSCTEDLPLVERILLNRNLTKNLINYYKTNSDLYCKILNLASSTALL
jgi:hypothetical protein